MDRSIVDTLTQAAVVKACKDRLLCGVRNHDTIRCLTATALSIFLTLSNICFAETRQFLHIVDPYCCLIGSFRKHITKVLLKFCQLLINLLHTCHLLLWEQGTSMSEVFIDYFQQLLILAFERIVFVVIYIFNTLEELLIKLNLVLKLRH